MSCFIDTLRDELMNLAESGPATALHLAALRESFNASVRQIVREEIAQAGKEGADAEREATRAPVASGKDALPAPSPSKPTHIRLMKNLYGLDSLTEGKVYRVENWGAQGPRIHDDHGDFTILSDSPWEFVEPTPDPIDEPAPEPEGDADEEDGLEDQICAALVGWNRSVLGIRRVAHGNELRAHIATAVRRWMRERKGGE